MLNLVLKIPGDFINKAISSEIVLLKIFLANICIFGIIHLLQFYKMNQLITFGVDSKGS